MKRWWCVWWEPARGPLEDVSPVSGGKFPEGVMGWWVKGRRSIKIFDASLPEGRRHVDQVWREVLAVVEAEDRDLAKAIVAAAWRPAEWRSVDEKRAGWWPPTATFPIDGRSPARWSIRRARG